MGKLRSNLVQHGARLPSFNSLAVIEAVRSGDAARAIRELGAFRVLCAHRRGAHGVATWMPRIETWLAGELPGFGTDQWYVGRPLLVTENDHGIRLYTAVTRARSRLMLVGTEESIRAAVDRPIARASGLRRRLWG